MQIKFIPILALSFLGLVAHAQDQGQISGNFQLNAQTYKPDSLIGANEVPEGILFNGFANINYTRDNFRAGLRYESYLNPMLGFDPRFKGNGIMYRYAGYEKDGLDITVGSFYEQFGSGVILRSYEERNLGYDNAFDGVRVKASMIPGIQIKALIGKQRDFFAYGDGIVRAIDIESQLTDYLSDSENRESTLLVGASFVSKFQEDLDPFYILPENVASFAGRVNYIYKGFDLYGEYAYKINDPSAVNNFIYKNGEALLFTGSYSTKGFGIILGAKRIDNMNYRSDRTALLNSQLINYLPALTKQHTYALPAFYPYATQPNGEIGFQGEVFYRIPKGTALGGKYGTQVSINYSVAYSIDQQRVHDTVALNESGTLGYESEFFALGDSVYFSDFNIAITRKINKTFKTSFMYMNQRYNRAVIEGKPGFLKANIVVAELQYKFRPKHSFRFEVQGLFMEDDKNKNNVDQGSWAMGLVEYNFAPHYFVGVQNLYNYGNADENRRINYAVITAGYITGSTRITLGYGRQRAGIFCVGGVCREVPASNGASISITSSF